MNGMDRASLITDLKGILKSSADKFTDPDDFARHLDIAASDLERLAPSYGQATITIAANEAYYPLPAGVSRLDMSLWGLQCRAAAPWDKRFPGKLPRIRRVEVDGVPSIMLTPPPTCDQIAALSSAFPFSYVRRYTIGDNAADTTVPEHRRALLLLRATVESLLELVNNGFAKPVALGGTHGVGAMPKNGHPAALAENLLTWCERMAT